MPIKWKSPDRFKPAPVFKRIDSVRTVNESGSVSYAGGDIQECLPTLQSMLQFPPAAAEVDTQTLVWQGLSRVGARLTPDTFLTALNSILSEKLAARETNYFILTSLSLDSTGLPKVFTILDCRINFVSGAYPRKFKSREDIVTSYPLSILDTPDTYVKVIIKVRAKSDGAAFHKAMKALDLLRAILCMMANPTMQFTIGGSPSSDPINVIRLGSRHTIHQQNGERAREGLWYEPGFNPIRVYRFKKPEISTKNLRWALRRIAKSRFQAAMTSALLRFVRAFDQGDHNTAFLRLWSALEALTTPGIADYDKLIRRTVFLFRELDYHRQVLEHLRAYRNANVHAGEESESAKIHCFQLQMYFVTTAWFFIRNSTRFSSVDEVGEFLDLPPNPSELQRRLILIKGAIKFTSPNDN